MSPSEMRTTFGDGDVMRYRGSRSAIHVFSLKPSTYLRSNSSSPPVSSTTCWVPGRISQPVAPSQYSTSRNENRFGSHVALDTRPRNTFQPADHRVVLIGLGGR